MFLKIFSWIKNKKLRILVISGPSLPKFFAKEDSYAIAFAAIKKKTGIDLTKSDIANLHRHGKQKTAILAE